MSYARIGKDSDVYIYGTRTSIELSVRRNLGARIDLPANPTAEQITAYFAEDNEIPFPNAHAGENQSFATYSACLTALESLLADEVRVPAYAFERLRVEQTLTDNYAEHFTLSK